MKHILLLLMLLIGSTATASAGSYNYVEADQFRQWLVNKKDMAIVDIQVPDEFQKHHFKGALETNAYPVKTADDKQKLDKVLPKLTATQNDVVVICPKGANGAKNAYDYLKMKGIVEKRIFILEDGMRDWPYKELTVSGN